jgi:hypothetical protein
MVAHVCNPSYLGGREQEDRSLRPAPAKSLPDTISTNKFGVVAHTCYPSNVGSGSKRISVQAGLDKNSRPSLKVMKAKEDWHVAQETSTFLPSTSSEFKPQYHQNKISLSINNY